MPPNRSTRTRPTRRPGPRRSPASRATRSSTCARICDQRREDQRQVDGDHRRGDEPLVPLDMNYRGVINCWCCAAASASRAAAGRTMSARRSCARRPAGRRSPSRSTGTARRGSMNSTIAFYAHTDQWRYEKLDRGDIASPTAPAGDWDGTLIDYNVRAERMGWLPSAPQLETNPLDAPRPRGCRARRRRICGAPPEVRRAQAVAAKTRTTRRTGRATCSCGAPTCWAPPARATNISSSTCSARRTASRAKTWARKAGTSRRGRLARRGAGGKARPAGDARLPHVHHLRLLRHRAADRDLVREERPQHLRHASLHPSAVGGGGSGMGGEERLGDLQGHRQDASRTSRRPSGHREGRRADADHARHARASSRSRSTCRTGRSGEMRPDSRQDHAGRHRGRARLSRHLSSASPRSAR